jgi:nitric oxide reductase subunit C
MGADQDGRAHRCLVGVLTGLIWLLAAAALLGSARSAGGNAARGATLFAELPCASCHDVTRPAPGGDVCPNLGNIATEAARIIRSPDYHGKAKDVAGYLRESILEPNAYIVPGPNYRIAEGQSVMPSIFGATLTPSQVDVVVAFLLTRR